MSRVIKKINKAAKYVTKKIGGADLADFIGAKIARGVGPKDLRKHITSRVTRREALKSAGKVGLAAAGAAGLVRGGGALIARSAAKRAAKAAKKAARKRFLKRSIKVAGQKKRVKVIDYRDNPSQGIIKGKKKLF